MKLRTWILAIAAAVVLVAVVGPWLYINVIRDDPPDRLEFSEPTATTAASTEPFTLAGDWTVTDVSEAGYRVDEILFGQSAEAVGRTEDVTGNLTIDGTTIADASFTVDLTTVASDESRRDNQFQGRIMDTATYPTATFTLTEPIALDGEPADLEEVTATATGELTLHGVTQTVTFALTARRNGDVIEVNGTIPVVFEDYDIPEPSFGPAEVGDNGEIEFLLTFTPASP